MSCECCKKDCHCDRHTEEVPARAIGTHAHVVLDYLELRAEWTRWKKADDGLVEELLARSRAARRSFRILATPALRAMRLREGRGGMDALYDALLQQQGSLAELVDGLASKESVQAILKREGVTDARMNAIHKELKAANMIVGNKGGTLQFRGPHGDRAVIRKPDSLPGVLPADGLLRALARNWTTRGRGMLGLSADATWAKAVPFREGLAHSLVNVDWFFDRDVRDLEDRCALPFVQGADAGSVIGVILVVVGVVLMAIAGCVDDPGLSEALFIIGAILTVAGIGVLAASGVPVEACAPDPVTGEVVCGRI